MKSKIRKLTPKQPIQDLKKQLAKIEEYVEEIRELTTERNGYGDTCQYLESQLAAAQQENQVLHKLLQKSKKYLEQCRCAGSDGWRAICKIIDATDARIAAEKGLEITNELG